MLSYQVAVFVSRLFEFYEILIVVWCIMSWLPMRQGGILYDIAVAIGRIVNPYLGFFRRFIPPLGGIDFSPVVAMIVLGVIRNVVTRLILLV